MGYPVQTLYLLHHGILEVLRIKTACLIKAYPLTSKWILDSMPVCRLRTLAIRFLLVRWDLSNFLDRNVHFVNEYMKGFKPIFTWH
jgi:hypothetical protein